MRRGYFLGLLALLGACATQPQTQIVSLTAEFDEAAARRLIEKGENTITGHAFINRGDGGFVTCASGIVELIPATDYATGRMLRIYGSDQFGASSSGVLVFEPDPPAYAIARRATICDEHGTFKFDGVADGTFYLVTGIWWTEADRLEGANLMQRVTTQDSEQRDIVLTRRSRSTIDRILSVLRPRRD